MTCKKLEILKPGYAHAHIKNLMKLKRKGTIEFIQGKKTWYSAIKKQTRYLTISSSQHQPQIHDVRICRSCDYQITQGLEKMVGIVFP